MEVDRCVVVTRTWHIANEIARALGHVNLPRETYKKIPVEYAGSVYFTVAGAPDSKRRISRIMEIEEVLKPTTMLIVKPGYTVQDMKARHIGPLEHWHVVEDSEMFYGLLQIVEGIQAVMDVEHTNILREAFGENPVQPDHFHHQQQEVIDVDGMDPDDAAAIEDALRANEREGYMDPYAAYEMPRQRQNPWNFDPYAIPGPRRRREQEQQQQQGALVQVFLNGMVQREEDEMVTAWRNANQIHDGFRRNAFVRRGLDVPRELIAPPAPPAPPPPPQQQRQRQIVVTGAGIGNTAAIMNSARRRYEESRRQTVIAEAMKAPDVKDMTKPREEDKDIEAMPTTKENNTCILCFDAHITTMLFPCLHFLYCKDCIDKQRKVKDICPSCNTAIQSVVQPRGKFNVQEEHRRRRRDRAYVEEIAREFQEEGQLLLSEMEKEPAEPEQKKAKTDE